MGDPNCNNRGWCGEGWPRKGLLSTFSMTYDDLARDLDANLAQIDMDDDLDMHSVLTTVNNYSDSQSDASSKVNILCIYLDYYHAMLKWKTTECK
jgi:hypothetical protein